MGFGVYLFVGPPRSEWCLRNRDSEELTALQDMYKLVDRVGAPPCRAHLGLQNAQHARARVRRQTY